MQQCVETVFILGAFNNKMTYINDMLNYVNVQKRYVWSREI